MVTLRAKAAICSRTAWSPQDMESLRLCLSNPHPVWVSWPPGHILWVPNYLLFHWHGLQRCPHYSIEVLCWVWGAVLLRETLLPYWEKKRSCKDKWDRNAQLGSCKCYAHILKVVWGGKMDGNLVSVCQARWVEVRRNNLRIQESKIFISKSLHEVFPALGM